MRAEAAAAATAAASAAPKKKSSKKKSAKKAAAAAPAQAPKKKSSKKKSAKKKAAVATVAAAPTAAKRSGKKKSKKSSKKKKGHKRSIERSSAITVHGKAMRKTAIRAHQGMTRRSTKTTYEHPRTGRKLSINHIMRMANPVGNWGNVLVLGGGAIVGFVVADMVDRFVATRAGDAKYPWYSHDAAQRIMLKPDGMRIAAQAGVAVVFFLGSYAAQNRMPKTAYFLAGAAIGAVVRVGSQLLVSYVMPAAFSVTKGNEKSLGNRMYPTEQSALQDEAQKTIDAENKTPANVPGQGGSDTELPASYLYPGKTATPAAPGSKPAGTGAINTQRGNPAPRAMHHQGVATRMTPRIIAGVGLGAPPASAPRPALNAPRPQMVYPQAQAQRQAQPVARAAQPQRAGQPFLGEPVATASGPAGVGGGDCPGCGAGLKRDQNVHDGLNVTAVWPRGAAIDVTGDMPMPASASGADIRANIAMQTADQGGGASSGPEVFSPGVQEVAPSELGAIGANQRYASNAAGKPRGIMHRQAAAAGLRGTPSLDSISGHSGHKNSLRSHLN